MFDWKYYTWYHHTVINSWFIILPNGTDGGQLLRFDDVKQAINKNDTPRQLEVFFADGSNFETAPHKTTLAIKRQLFSAVLDKYLQK